MAKIILDLKSCKGCPKFNPGDLVMELESHGENGPEHTTYYGLVLDSFEKRGSRVKNYYTVLYVYAENVAHPDDLIPKGGDIDEDVPERVLTLWRSV